MLKKIILTISIASALLITAACGQTNTSPVKNNENQSVSSSENSEEKINVKSSYFAYDNDKKLALKIKNAKLEFNDIANNIKYTGNIDKNSSIKCTSNNASEISCTASNSTITITIDKTKHTLPIIDEDKYMTYIQLIPKEQPEESEVIQTFEPTVSNDDESNPTQSSSKPDTSEESSSSSNTAESNSAQSSIESSPDESENSSEPDDYTKYALGNYYSISGEMKNIYNISIARNGDNILVTLGISPQFSHLDKFDDTTRFYASVPDDYFVKRNAGKYWFKIDLGKKPRDEQKTVTLGLGQEKKNDKTSIIGHIKCGDYSEEIVFERL